MLKGWEVFTKQSFQKKKTNHVNSTLHYQVEHISKCTSAHHTSCSNHNFQCTFNDQHVQEDFNTVNRSGPISHRSKTNSTLDALHERHLLSALFSFSWSSSSQLLSHCHHHSHLTCELLVQVLWACNFELGRSSNGVIWRLCGLRD